MDGNNGFRNKLDAVALPGYTSLTRAEWEEVTNTPSVFMTVRGASVTKNDGL